MKCNRCRNQAREGFKLCRRCQQHGRDWCRPDRINYTPLDITIDHPQTRVLRRLVRFGDWVSHEDLMDSFGAEGTEQREPLVTALSKLKKRCSVEKQKRSGYPRNLGNGSWWRITATGRSELERRLQTDMAVEDDGYREAM